MKKKLTPIPILHHAQNHCTMDYRTKASRRKWEYPSNEAVGRGFLRHKQVISIKEENQ